MNEDNRKSEHMENTEKPVNPLDVPAKADEPDADRTKPGTVPTEIDEINEPLEESTFASEHDISREHSEPTRVTGTTNDNAIDGEYIDVGGGD